METASLCKKTEEQDKNGVGDLELAVETWVLLE